MWASFLINFTQQALRHSNVSILAWCSAREHLCLCEVLSHSCTSLHGLLWLLCLIWWFLWPLLPLTPGLCFAEVGFNGSSASPGSVQGEQQVLWDSSCLWAPWQQNSQGSLGIRGNWNKTTLVISQPLWLGTLADHRYCCGWASKHESWHWPCLLV